MFVLLAFFKQRAVNHHAKRVHQERTKTIRKENHVLFVYQILLAVTLTVPRVLRVQQDGPLLKSLAVVFSAQQEQLGLPVPTATQVSTVVLLIIRRRANLVLLVGQRSA